MAKPDTFSPVRNRYPSEKDTHRERGTRLEYRIRKLDRICQKLREKPALHAGVTSQEILEILQEEQRRLTAALHR